MSALRACRLDLRSLISMFKYFLLRQKSGGEPPSTLSDSIAAVLILGLLVLAGHFAAARAQESTATRDRRISNGAPAQATVTVNEQFLNSFLTAIFDNLQEPAMPLTIGGSSTQGPSAQCASEIRLKREVQGVRTAVHFENGRITGPLAFAGAYSSTYLGCVQFSGWADAEVNLEYNSERRAVVARFHLRDIHL